MPLTLRPATTADKAGITETHHSAFAGGVITERVFPPSELTVRNWERDLDSYFADPSVRLLVVEDDATTPPTVVGFAKWSCPRPEGTPAPAPRTEEQVMGREWPPGADLELARAFLWGMEKKRREVMGDRRFWFLHILVVRPEYQGRGAGRLMIRWGIDRADAEGLPCYVDSTPVAKAVYKRYGFEEVDRLVIEKADHGGEDLVETMMVRPAKR